LNNSSKILYVFNNSAGLLVDLELLLDESLDPINIPEILSVLLKYIFISTARLDAIKGVEREKEDSGVEGRRGGNNSRG